MKKLFVLTAIFALVLAGCDEWFNPDDGNGNNNDIAGTWTYGDDEMDVTFTITSDKDISNSGTWVMTIQTSEGMQSNNGTWYRNGNNLTMYGNYGGGTVSASLSGDTLIVNYDGTTVQLKKGGSSSDGTSLKIQNDSSFDITEVKWSNVSFTQGTASIEKGKSVTKTVQEGSGYIYFKRKTYPINARTKYYVVLEKNEQKVERINDNTPIVDVDNPANEGTLGTLGVNREPQITVNAGETVIEQFGDYNFGSALLNSNRDVTFTIGNSGKADLKFNAVDVNVVNLSNNASGYFSVVQQPFASMTIAPGSTTTFVIRFSPETLGNNFNAEVTIVTNSENNKQFTFRVKGNGSNSYSIGDTGPGGGTIFFAQGGQYKEVSGELGLYNWNAAKTTAQNYNGGGLTNWHLPDNGELSLLYENKTVLGGFINAYYWSSSFTGDYAYNLDFSTGILSNTGLTSNPYYNTSTLRVRAVRSFSL